MSVPLPLLASDLPNGSKALAADCWMCDGIGLWPPVEREAESVLDACPVCLGRQAVAPGDPWTAKTKAPVIRGGNPGRGLTSAADCETLCRSPGDRLDSP